MQAAPDQWASEKSLTCLSLGVQSDYAKVVELTHFWGQPRQLIAAQVQRGEVLELAHLRWQTRQLVIAQDQDNEALKLTHLRR